LPTISIEQKELEEIIVSNGGSHDLENIAENLPLIGCDIDKCDEEVLEVEIFPDRPDLLSAETLSHAILPFLEGKEAKPALEITKGHIEMVVDHQLKDIRPVILGAVVRGVEVDDDLIKRLMDHQEKLHFSLGRRRKRASIGVHDLATITPPFRVIAAKRDHRFRPLASDEEMSIEEILTSHDKGVEYAHLLDGMDEVPLIIDSENQVLSFPPIINGYQTTVTDSTTDLLIDVTGWDERACETCLMLICLQLSYNGGIIESVNLTDYRGEKLVLPRSGTTPHVVQREMVQGLLGIEFSDEELSKAINRMGGKLRYSSKEDMIIEMPHWRYDLLHPIDLVEEIAIGHGYENLGTAVPRSPLTAQPREDAELLRRVRTSLIGLGMIQIQSLTLSNPSDQFDAMRWPLNGEVTEIANPITTEHTILRQYLLPSLFRLLSANRHHELPQKVFEMGSVIREHHNNSNCAFLCAEIGGFANVRGRIQSLMRDLGISNWSVRDSSEGPWIEGRGASLLVGETKVGEFGEVDPEVSELFELNVPLNGCEIDITALSSLIDDPVG